MMQQNNTPRQKPISIKAKHALPPQNKDDLDSRENEEQQTKGNAVTHNKKETKEKRKKQSF